MKTKQTWTDNDEINLVKTEDNALVVRPVNIDIINLWWIGVHKFLECRKEDSHTLTSGNILLVTLEGLMTNAGAHDVVNCERLEMSRGEVWMCKSGDRDCALVRDEFRDDSVSVEDTDRLLRVL